MSLTKATFSMIDGAVINVKDYGAVGDNVTDDTAAIQAALDVVTNGTVFIPAGQYKITDTLKVNYSNVTFQNCVNLIGEGQGSSLYWHGDDNKPMLWYEGVTANAGWFSQTVIEKLYFKNQNLSSGLTGILLGNFSSVLGFSAGVANVTIRNNKMIDMDICVQTEYESDGVYIEENVFETYGVYGVYNVGTAAMHISKNYFSSGGAGSVAIHCEYATNNIIDNLIQSPTVGVTGAIQLVNVAGFTVTGNYIEFPQPGPAWAILTQNSSSGYIGSNTIQGMQNSDAIYLDVNSRDINVGPNSFGFFGFPMASLIRGDGATGVNVLGEQDYILSPVTISVTTPAVVTSVINAQGMQAGEVVFFTTTGTLPTGFTPYQYYYVTNVSGASFEVSLTLGGPSIAATGAGSGVHTCHVVLANELDGTAFNFSFNNSAVCFGVSKYTDAPNAGITLARSGVINIGNTNQATGWGFQSFNRTGVQIGSVTQSGTTGVLYNTTSDYRLKEFKQTLAGAGERIDALKPTEFVWKSDNTLARGFFAHEFQEVYPDSVTGEKDAVSENGDPKYQVMQAGSAEVIADLVSEIQNLRKRVSALEAK